MSKTLGKVFHLVLSSIQHLSLLTLKVFLNLILGPVILPLHTGRREQTGYLWYPARRKQAGEKQSVVPQTYTGFSDITKVGYVRVKSLALLFYISSFQSRLSVQASKSRAHRVCWEGNWLHVRNLRWKRENRNICLHWEYFNVFQRINRHTVCLIE